MRAWKPGDLARMGKTKVLRELKNVPATRRSTNLALTPRAQVVLGYLVYGIDEQDPNHPDIPTGSWESCLWQSPAHLAATCALPTSTTATFNNHK